VGADIDVLVPAALLHDVVNLPKNDPNRKQASAHAAQVAGDILTAACYSEGETLCIRTVIEEHSYSLGRQPTSLESAVLQDADRLDALGAIGVLRAATCGCRLGAAYYDLDDPFAETRNVDDARYTIDHFFAKLLRLSEHFNTDVAKREGAKRTAFMRQFLAQLKGEICP
jgi:uncharacterized protein